MNWNCPNKAVHTTPKPQELPPMPKDPAALQARIQALDPSTKTRVKNLAATLAMGAVAKGLVPKDTAAIKEAMPRFFQEALEITAAVDEFLS